MPPPERPSPGVASGARREVHFRLGNEIAAANSPRHPLAQELRRAARARAYALRRKGVPVIPALPPSHGGAR
jgi:hypothetical protein